LQEEELIADWHNEFGHWITAVMPD
jgi:hypothetical protein